MKYCLILDNDDQIDQITILQTKGTEQKFPITCYYFKPDRQDCTRLENIGGSPSYVIDLEKLAEALEEEFSGKQIDLIASDYMLDDPLNIDGLEVIKYLKEHWRAANIPCLIYSGKSQLIKEKLQKEVLEVADNADELNEFLVNYFDYRPNHVVKRGEYVDSILSFLKKPQNKLSLGAKLNPKLSIYSDKKFSNIFPRFEGRTLGDIANFVKNNTEESDVFEDEFLDRCIAHFIHLEE